jgi:hypothetical protein
MRFAILGLLLLMALLIQGCIHVKTDPIEVKPITLNVNLRVERELNDFFAYEKDTAPTTATAATAAPPVAVPTTIPAAQP